MQPQRRKSLLAVVCALLIGLLTTLPVSAQRSTFASPILVVNTSFLNVRTGPGTDYSILAAVVGGTELPVLGVARDLVWYQVATNAGVGWVNVEFTLARGDFTNVPFVEAPPALQFAPVVITSPVVVNPGQGGGAAPVNTVTTPSVTGRTTSTGISGTGGDLWSEPGYRGTKLFGPVTDQNTIYTVLNATSVSGTRFYQINVPGVGLGWTDKVRFRPLRCTAADTVGVLLQPQQTLPAGTEGYVNAIVNNIATFEIPNGGTFSIPYPLIGHRPDSVVSLCQGATTVNSAAALGQGGGAVVTTFAAPQAVTNRVVVNTGNLNVRSGPGAGFSVIFAVPGGTELAMVGRAPDDIWFLVQGAFGQGWVASEFVLFRGDFASVPIIRDAYRGGVVTSAVPINAGQGGGGVTTVIAAPAPVIVNPPIPQAVTNRIIINTGNLNIRSGPGPGFSVIFTVPGGTELAILGRTNDEESWYLVQGAFGQGWVDSEFVIFRGDFATVPIIDLR